MNRVVFALSALSLSASASAVEPAAKVVASQVDAIYPAVKALYLDLHRNPEQYGLAGARAVLLHVGAVDPAKLAEAKQSGVPVPDVHSPLWSPVREPAIKSAIVAEVAILMDSMSPHS